MKYIEQIFENLTPVKNVSGGSGAETWIVKNQVGSLFVRKFGKGETGEKLKLQTNWLNIYSESVNCPSVLTEGQLGDHYYYDMNLLEPAETAFQKILSDSTKNTSQIIISALNEFDHLFRTATVNTGNREKYFEEKFFKNIEKTKFLNPQFEKLANAEEININGKSYSGLKKLLATNSVKRVLDVFLKEPLYSAGHGDLTLSNILIQNSCAAFIDPNPGFTVISKSQEYAKVLQSTLTQYELFEDLSYQLNLDELQINYIFKAKYDFSQFNDLLLKSKAFQGLEVELILLHLAVHLIRILPYVKPENNHRKFIYFAEVVKLFTSLSERNLPI